MSSILILGDSWGLGEWDFNPYKVRHAGLQHYLEEAGYVVCNQSRPGSSNKGSITRIRKSNLQNFDYVFWIQSDPLRDLRPYSQFHELTNVELMIEQNKILLNQSYYLLNALDHPIHCIGGCAKLEVELMKPHANLIPFIPSILEYIHPDEKQPDIWISDWINKIPKNFSDFERLISIKKYIDSWSTNPKFREYFYPDGFHPNRKAHAKIFDYVHAYINKDAVSNFTVSTIARLAQG